MKTLTKSNLRQIAPYVIIELIAALLIILWLYTGITKLLAYQETQIQMSRSPFIASIAGFTAFALPIAEILLAILLIFKKTRLLGLYGSLFLMTLFTGYIYVMLHFSYDLPCSCGGVLRQLSWDEHLYFNIGFTLLSLLGILLQSLGSNQQTKETVHYSKA